MPKIAVVEDDVATNNSHCRLLSAIPDADVHPAFSLAEAEVLIAQGGFDLLVIDIDLGGGPQGRSGGLKLLGQYGSQVTTIIVSGIPEDNLRDISLTLKAYEFITKPVHAMDFENKVRHALAFSGSAAGKIVPREATWPNGLHPDIKRPPNLLWNGKSVNLTLTELTIVHCLAMYPGEVIAYGKLAAAMKTGDSPRALSTHVTGVRKKFVATDSKFDRIVAIPGKGYCWKADGE
ncbi:MAG: winged helix-turn-helix domain-containing protein [Undibacterium umbellatum]|uniref:response regulator transcription factor n=1 Tax=Undibacterium umbellatum TaxID=2762300 RepID=UPI003BB806AE